MGADRGHLRLVREVEAGLQKAARTKDTFARHRAMSQLTKRAISAYEDLVDRIFSEMLRYIGTEIVPGLKLKKAADSEQKFSLLTATQLEELKRLVRDYHTAFAAGMFGPDAIPPDELQRLQRAGILREDLETVFAGQGAPPAQRITDLAYQYGAHLGDAKQRPAVTEMGIDKFRQHLERTRQDLSPVERQAMAFARYNAGEHVRGMGDRLSTQVGTIIRNADAEQRRRYLGTIQQELEANIDKRQEWRKLASEIGHATKDWSRDMQRLAATEKQFAMQEGAARSMAKGRDPGEVRVAKIPSPDACPDCVRLHLTAGKGSPPRIFKLSDLQANGNVGVKRAGWKATVGPVHPWCGCELVEVPDGWAFDEDGDLVPEIMLKKGDRLDRSVEALEKAAHLTYTATVPDDHLVVRVADPQRRQIIEQIIAAAPPEIFHKDVGVTLITTETDRAGNPMGEDDFAYWTGNEIRISQTLPLERLPRVIRHEIGHTLNVYLMHQLGGPEPVRKWHDRLWATSQAEGFVSTYAELEPIENAAEVTRMYLFERGRLMLNHPHQFAFVHRAYRGIWE